MLYRKAQDGNDGSIQTSPSARVCVCVCTHACEGVLIRTQNPSASTPPFLPSLRHFQLVAKDTRVRFSIPAALHPFSFSHPSLRCTPSWLTARWGWVQVGPEGPGKKSAKRKAPSPRNAYLLSHKCSFPSWLLTGTHRGCLREIFSRLCALEGYCSVFIDWETLHFIKGYLT